MSHESLLLNYPAELAPRKGFNEQNQVHIGAALHAQTSFHSVFGAVQGLAGYMDWACAFFMPILIVFGVLCMLESLVKRTYFIFFIKPFKVYTTMEVKKKFEKPQMEVVKLKPAYMVSACSSHSCGAWDECWE